MSRIPIGIVLNGVTGRMGYRQHLVRSLLAIREQGGLPSRDGSLIWPEPVLVGRNAAKLEQLAQQHGLTEWTTDLDAALARHDVQSTSTRRSPSSGRRRSGPPSTPASTSTPRSPWPRAPTPPSSSPAPPARPASSTASCRTSCSCPGCASSSASSTAASSAGSCRYAASSATGSSKATGRPRSARRWNYRTADGGGIVVDMFPHWHYVLEQLFGPVRSVHGERCHPHPDAGWTSTAQTYEATADDAAYGIFELEGGIVAQINSSWAVRVLPRRAGRVPGGRHPRQRGRRAARVPHPAPRHHPEAGVEPGPAGHRDVPRAVAGGAGQRGVRQRLQGAVGAVPAARRGRRRFPWDFAAGARGVQLAELGLQSAREGRRIEIPALDL